MLTIALFGTSADPPTEGHRLILTWLAHHFDRVAVWVANNPFKTHQAPLADRVAMLRLLIESSDVLRSRVELDPQLSHPRTLFTVQRARERWPEAEFSLVIGADLVTQLPTWYQAGQLLRQVKVLIIPRPGYAIPKEGIERLRQMGTEVTIADLQGLPVSSSRYREEQDTAVLPASVRAYIHQQQLYRCQGETIQTP
ncbi:nicotinate-nucleotide adenylyltransferase [Trichothermofontia sichuanensis B231]|uniref:nicotinate-nucleotide adenylyltransferase n=1 Tax=Trichothermofontia sichuanensis TaxID=3045816 RepID=UPI0022455A72|nr:nicotinate-nucleotide adenylyltransferase [Trichothermofontia sichuanensis]UZQ53811.1 nicotinate-nucleotide adenylyltransferase [Trichothermofontia sichuanensis B231]